MDMDAIYTNTMVSGVDDDNVPPPVGVGVGQRFMTKDALQMYLKEYCISRHVQFKTLQHWPLDERMLPYIEAAGFSALHRVQWLRLDKPLITALVERWRSETNTFHLVNSEITITLEDVAVLLGLRVDGDAVTGSTRGDWIELAKVLLGVELPPGSFQGGRLSLLWIRGRFSFCPDDATELVIQQHARVPRPSCGCDDILGCTVWGTSTYWTSYTPRGTGAAGWPFRFQVEHPTDECQKPRWKPSAIQDRVGPPAELSVTPPEDVEHVTRISRKGRVGEDWALYHRDYIARWEARAESLVMVSRAHTPRHAPNDYMRWYLGATRRFISPPLTEPAMVYHPRGYTEEALLGCVRNVVDRVNHREALDPSSVDPYLMEIGHYCQSMLHSLPLLEGAIVDGDVSHVSEPSHVVEPAREHHGGVVQGVSLQLRRRLVSRTDEVPAVLEPTVPDLPPGHGRDRPEPLERAPLGAPEPSRHPPILRDLYKKAKKKQLVHRARLRLMTCFL
ncbi:hypothetical protein H6P81_016296 [Aristolochia fimbriata]|uniref:Aminotransferase-like plant mobile domain-containing protein n=1 Tax=Aristolochia fimbriata TaxID=158543 RepID=A0AAV7EAT9_ARIFI|nr:hypothetical protein H6P81_016296 [Aristolochia fimbriata]